LPRFHPHFNHAMGKMYWSSRDLTKDMKAKGLEFVPKNASIDNAPIRRSYKVSSDTRKVISAIQEQTKSGKFKPSGRLLDAIRRKSDGKASL